MPDREYLDCLRRSRADLVAQIKRSSETVEHSLELIRRMDDLLAKAGRNR
jgi:hypothetical protein